MIVTGSSHAGKSSLIRELEARVSRPSATVSIDAVIATIDLPEAELWERGLTLAYEAAAERTEQLLVQGMTVFYESTFTYIPPDHRPPEFHEGQLQRLLEIAGRVGSEVAVLQLSATLEDVSNRQRESGRLDPTIVRETWRRHADALKAPLILRLDTSRRSAADLAEQLVQRFAFLSAS